MAKNNLTPEQDLLTREFFQRVASDESLFPDDPVGRRNMLACIVRLLGYTGTTNKTVRFGQTSVSDITEEWAADEARAREALNEASNGADSDEANSGESPESSEVRETVLREDL